MCESESTIEHSIITFKTISITKHIKKDISENRDIVNKKGLQNNTVVLIMTVLFLFLNVYLYSFPTMISKKLTFSSKNTEITLCYRIWMIKNEYKTESSRGLLYRY